MRYDIYVISAINHYYSYIYLDFRNKIRTKQNRHMRIKLILQTFSLNIVVN